MLSRIAESLFWTGRYVERADDVARILDVHLHHLLEEPTVDETTACSALLAAMGVAVGETAPVAASVTEKLAFDDTNPSSILVSSPRSGSGERPGHQRRHFLPRCGKPHQCHRQRLRVPGPNGAIWKARTAFSGSSENGPPCWAAWPGLHHVCKDDAWRFLVLGRSLERVDMLARLLSTEVADDPAGVDWVTLLRSCSGHEAFLRTYRREPEPGPALEFLLRERLFPRSILCALLTAEDCLSELDPGRQPPGTHDEARRLVA